MDTLEPGEQVEIVATDAGFARDASAWCDTTGNRLVGSHEDKGRYTVVIEKGNSNMVCPSSTGTVAAGRGKTLILFSDDLDKALATFVLANGAAATGQKVTVFFTFWGLNVLLFAKDHVGADKVEKENANVMLENVGNAQASGGSPAAYASAAPAMNDDGFIDISDDDGELPF